MAQTARTGGPGPGRIALMTLAVALALTGTALAQAVRGTLLGNVTDAQAAPVPGVTVTATETRTNVTRTAVTNQSGHYVFANMQDGLYRVETELSGFKKFSRDGIQVKVNSTMRVDVILEVGAMTETVEVVQETPLLQTDRADTGRTIEGRQVQELPLSGGRNFQGMWATVPGTVTLSAAALAVLQPPGQPGNQVQRPVAPVEQRPDRRPRRQPQDRPSHRPHPVRRVHRLRQRHDVELRRGVRARRRVGDDGRPEVGHQPAQGQRLRVREQRVDPGPQLLRLAHLEEARHQVPAVRGDARWPDHQGQALLLHRLPANGGQPRPAAAGGDPAHRVAQRRLLERGDEDLRPGHRERGRHGSHPVPGQRHPHQPPQLRGPEHPRPGPAAEHPRCRLRPGELRAPEQRAREDDRRLQRQAELQPHRERPDVAALQLPAAGDLRPRDVRRARRRRRRLRRHRLPEHLQRGPHLDPHPVPEPHHGVAGRLLEVPQRGAVHGPGARELDRGGHPGRQLRRLLERHQQDQHRQRLHGPARRLLGQPPLGPG